MTDEKLTEEQKLRVAFEAGKRAGAQEQGPLMKYGYRGQILGQDKDPGGEAYEDELKSVVGPLKLQGITGARLANHPDVAAVKVRHGRS